MMIKLFENYNQIAEICNKYNIRNWTLNADGSIDVLGNVELWSSRLIELPLKFGRVNGLFRCDQNKLTTLEGAPREVGGSFWCDNNNLTTLEGCPREVGGSFWCDNNKLTTLEGAPREVGGSFYCDNNKLPEYFTRFLNSNKNSYDPILKEILKWQDEYELWKDPKNFEKKFKWMMEDIQENDLPDIKIKFPR